MYFYATTYGMFGVWALILFHLTNVPLLFLSVRVVFMLCARLKIGCFFYGSTFYLSPACDLVGAVENHVQKINSKAFKIDAKLFDAFIGFQFDTTCCVQIT